MATGLLGISLSGLNAAQAGIRTAQHNISNINTPGFRRQEVDYASSTPNYSGAGAFGSGVGVSAVRSLYSQFQDSQVLLNQAQLSRNESFASQASQVDSLVSNVNSGLTGAMSKFFDAAQTVASDPTSNAARQVMLSAGRNLSSRFNTLATAFDDIRVDTNREIASTVTQINAFASQIAQTSSNILRFEATSGKPANDLRDQRDQQVAELNKLISVTPVQQGDGAFSVFIGNGQPLVAGPNAMKIDDSTNSQFKVPTLILAGGGMLTLDASMVSGGKLGGLLAAREDVLMPAMNDLNRIAFAISTEINAVHLNGMQLDGLTAGAEFFTPAMTQVGGATGWLRLGESATGTALPAQDYSVVWDGADFTVTRVLDGVVSLPVAPGTEVIINGEPQGFSLYTNPDTNTNPILSPNTNTGSWTLNFSQFSARTMRMELSAPSQLAASASVVTPGPGNNVNMLALAALQTTGILNNGDATFSGAYTQLVTRTATFAAEADVGVAAFETLTRLSTQARQSVSGVNLDEEAANLIRFQQAYQASARAMQISSSLFNDLLSSLR